MCILKTCQAHATGDATENQGQEQVSSEKFCGVVKSFNMRRRFGFVSCEETAMRFQRDVYLSKDEAVMLAQEPAVGLAASDAPVNTEDKSSGPPVQEGDFLLFQVGMSTEGFPQVVCARKIRRLRGVVQRAASATSDGIVIVQGDGCASPDGVMHGPDRALMQLLGAEVQLRQADCGQLQLMPNDEVAFCCVTTKDADSQVLEAQLVELLHTPRVAGSSLGCFSLEFPRAMHGKATEDMQSATEPENTLTLQLDGYALTDRVMLTGVPRDLDVPELMRLFGKIGGTDATVTLPDNESFGLASVTFNGPEDVARFLARAGHTVSELGTTQLARLGPCHQRKGGAESCSCAFQAKVCAAPMQETAVKIKGNSEVKAEPKPQASQSDAPPLSEQTVYTLTQPSLPTCTPCCSVIAADMFAIGAHGTQPANDVAHWPASQDATASHMPVLGACPPCKSSWRCMHGNIVLPPADPELVPANENGRGVSIQWPTVIHATGYVVEFFEYGTTEVQRFVHTVPENVAVPLMDFSVMGLRTSAYASCVRCVAPCGCESAPSQWSLLPPAVMQPSAPSTLAPGWQIPPPPQMPQLGQQTLDNMLEQVSHPPPPNPPMLSTAPPTTSSLPAVPEESADDALVLD